MIDDWWRDPDKVAALVEWMRNDGYEEWVLPGVVEKPWEWSWVYKEHRHDFPDHAGN